MNKTVSYFFILVGSITIAFNVALLFDGYRDAYLFIGIVSGVFNIVFYGDELKRA
jgi:predicted permease